MTAGELIDKVEINGNDALIVVDIQNDFLKGGALEVPEGNSIIIGVNELCKIFRSKGGRIIFTQDWHPAGHFSFASSHEGKNPFDPIEGIKGIGPVLWPDHCIQGSHGSEFHDDLDKDMAHLIIRKGFHKKIDSYSAIIENDQETETGLDGYLKSLKISRVFFVGLALDYCVNFSAQDTRNKGYEVYVAHDLSRGIAEEKTASSMEEMANLGIKFMKSQNIN